MNICNKYLVCLFCLALSPQLLFSQQNSERDLKSIINAEFEKVKAIAPTLNIHLGHINYSDESESHVVNGDSNIVLNVKEIEKYTNDSSINFKSLFVRFVIAHELGHKIQFGGYSRDVINESKGEQLVFLECDADILAGFIIGQIFYTIELPHLTNQSNFNIEAYTQKRSSDIFKVYMQIIKMDKVNEKIKTHPSNDQRLVAVRQGILLSTWSIYNFVFSNEQLSTSKLSDPEVEKDENMYDMLTKGLGLYSSKTGVNPFLWAHEEAIRIIHENGSLARDLVRYDEEINWDKSPAHPTVYFSFRIVNYNSRTVRFSGKVFTEIVLRTDPKNVIKLAPIDAFVFDQTLFPGQDIRLSGELHWLAEKEYMPHIVLPGYDRSLYWVFDKNNPMPDRANMLTYDVNFSTWNANSLDDIVDLINFIVAKRNTLINYASGIGISKETDRSQIQDSPIYYQPNFKTESSDDQQILYNRKDSTITYTFNAFTSSDSGMAKLRLDQIIKKIALSLPRFQQFNANATEINKAKFVDNARSTISIFSRYDYSSHTYEIPIEVTNHE